MFLSPPWGGPKYAKNETFDLNNIMHPIGGVNLFNIARKITDHVAYFLPRNVDTMQVNFYNSRRFEKFRYSILLYFIMHYTSIAFIYIYTNLQLAMLAAVGGGVEVEQNFLDRKLIALTAYYGELPRDC